MPKDCNITDDRPTLLRPRLLVETARYGAQRYKRRRDLPGAVAGLLAKPASQIIPQLTAAEAKCEEERRKRSAAYRPARHVQILAALLAESAAIS